MSDSNYRIRYNLGGQGALTPAPAPAPEAPLIEFLCDPELAGKIPPPERAIRFAPDWFKRLNREMGMTY